MSTHHVPESTLVGERHTIGIDRVSDTVGRLGKNGTAVSESSPHGGNKRLIGLDAERTPAGRSGWWRVCSGLRGVDPESVEAPSERIVHGFLTREDEHIVRMDPEPTSAEA